MRALLAPTILALLLAGCASNDAADGETPTTTTSGAVTSTPATSTSPTSATPTTPTSASPTPTSPTSATPTPTSPTTPALPTSAAVRMDGYAFLPGYVQIAPGGNVTWTNNDGALHTVTADLNSTFDKLVEPNGKFTFTFTEPGTYNYHCNYHGNMRAVVQVG